MERWHPGRTWFAGPDAPDHAYTLAVCVDTAGATRPHAALDRLWAAFRDTVSGLWAGPGGRFADPDAVDVGGAVVRRERDRLTVCSGGEDAMDSIEYVTELLVQAAEQAGLDEQLRWRELPRTPA